MIWFWNIDRSFIEQNTNISISGCRVHLEDNQSPNSLDLNKIHLVLIDSNNNIILDKVFQDSYGLIIIKQEEVHNDKEIWKKKVHKDKAIRP